MALRKTNNPMLQLACLQFINAIVNTPEDIDFKIHLRNEFMRGGLEEMLTVRHTLAQCVCVCVCVCVLKASYCMHYVYLLLDIMVLSLMVASHSCMISFHFRHLVAFIPPSLTHTHTHTHRI